MSDAWLLYGAYGYTGELIARRAAALGMRPVLAGRDRKRTESLASELGLEARVFGLGEPDALRAGLRGMSAVLHGAGPYVRTWRPVADACLAEGCHYLDLTGEIDVIESLSALDAEARARGILLLPAVGFDVVPTDCAAAIACRALREPRAIEIGFHTRGGVSRGTLRTTFATFEGRNRVRVGGRIVTEPLGARWREIPFSDRPRQGVAIPWGDVSTAFYSTGAGDIVVYKTGMEGLTWMRRVAWLLRTSPVRWLLDRVAASTTHGPSAQDRARGATRVWCRASGANDRNAVVELAGPEGYELTAIAAVAAVERVLSGRTRVDAGFATPSMAFGADFVRDLEGVEIVREP